jgi:carboxypeptidase C (cathepsin A)
MSERSATWRGWVMGNLLGFTLFAWNMPAHGDDPAIKPPPPSVTEHQITVDGQPLKYKTTAGFIPMKDDAGKEKANFFFIAYEKERAAGTDISKRPVAFVFNGGPGSSSVWLHLGTAGPWRVKLKNELGEAPAPPFEKVENEYTWLQFTDLVFIDPVGTGYSRPAQGEPGAQFFGVTEDVSSVADFIRMYTSRYDRWLSPKFLAGESYGTTRAAGLSDYLAERYGISLNGIALVSVVLDFGTLRPGNGNDLPYVLFLPSYTASAWYHKKLGGELQADLKRSMKRAEKFAVEEYMVALQKGSSLSAEERRGVVEKLAMFTGLPADAFEKANLRVGPSEFRKRLLSADRSIIGRFDSRITGFDPAPNASSPEFDPSGTGFIPPYTSIINDYLKRTLKFENEMNYEVLTGRVQPWNYGPAGNGYLFVADELRAAMIKNPHLKVLFASGYYDLATPYFATDYTVNQMDLGPVLRGNIRQTYYPGGHMMYHEAGSLKALRDDIRQLIEGK